MMIVNIIKITNLLRKTLIGKGCRINGTATDIIDKLYNVNKIVNKVIDEDNIITPNLA